MRQGPEGQTGSIDNDAGWHRLERQRNPGAGEFGTAMERHDPSDPALAADSASTTQKACALLYHRYVEPAAGVCPNTGRRLLLPPR